ncbi:MAG: NAD(P)-dependent alcohol dehydrogenase [Planctomycetes bacterium]|nr:NAD(P)-dependent alcohol dehydrogenase [Planctomycetota bacterium]
MRAIVQQRYGHAEVLTPAIEPIPTPAPGEVLVRVMAAGLDRGVWHMVAGKPYLMRVMGFGLRRPKTRIPGMDLAGVVQAVGSGVTRFKAGDEVLGTAIGAGAFAEFAKLKEAQLVHKPANLSFEQAAALPVSALAALKAVRDVAKVQAGQQVLVIGAGGGVGSYAVQIAKALGATVTGVASTGKLRHVLALGADHVIDYTRQDFADDGPRFDVIIDIAGNRTLRHLRSALKPRGTLVIAGGENAGNWFGGMDRQIRAMLLSAFTRQKLTSFVSIVNLPALKEIARLAEDGVVTPVVDRTFTLEQTPEAFAYLESAKACGKIVITPSTVPQQG